MIIHINGWPGAGKKTIGEALAAKIGARFIHNHLLHDVAIVCAGFGSEARWRLYEIVRAAAYETLAARPASEVFVMTNALCTNSPRERVAWRHVVDLALSRSAPLIPVVLNVEPAELFRRVQSVERIRKKLTDPAKLQEFLDLDTLQLPDVPERLEVNVTELTPEEAAQAILEYIEAIRPHLRPATTGHLKMRVPMKKENQKGEQE
jgi:broad-specificity NMP kinase